MTAVRMIACCATLIAGLASAAPVQAAILSTLSIRELTIAADVIVVAEPIEPRPGILPVAYRVTDVLLGPKSLVGEKLTVRDDGLHRLGSRWEEVIDKPRPREQMRKALLFLANPPEGLPADEYGVVMSGIRAIGPEGQVLVPRQERNPGPMYLRPEPAVTWDSMLTRVRRDLPRIARIRELGTIPDFARRNEAIFKWIAEHRSELGSDIRRDGAGWGPLQQQLFEWVMESCVPDDCWKVVELSAEVGWVPQGDRGSFCSPGGRELLLQKVFDSTLSGSLRQRALQQLGTSGSSWCTYRKEVSTVQILTREEQERLIDRITPLLGHAEPYWRRDAVFCLRALSHPGDTNLAAMETKRAIPALVALFGSEGNTEVRREIVQALRTIEDAAFWQKLTGNPEGLTVLISGGSSNDGRIEFKAGFDGTRAPIKEVPSFRFEKLSGDVVTETRTVAATIRYPEDTFARGGTDWQGFLLLSVPSSKLTAGVWRVTLEGRLGEQSWRSDFIEITVPERSMTETDAKPR